MILLNQNAFKESFNTAAREERKHIEMPAFRFSSLHIEVFMGEYEMRWQKRGEKYWYYQHCIVIVE
ncbi:hypothetical protein [Sphingobacterium sp. JB170]|uniref:hypothetical protein n=1 Tax=Sphingobacterium sp. JB170 TaxID=1434842 RepID=UPI00097F3104|nr:hypothetical protein [Sphingobacterium sp. JB170]SJN49850.1 hypothetical protein FM107_19340 [Sphingobacterium sp. JB170]